jgi:hypothetical protein
MQTKSHTIRAIFKDYDENTEDKIDYRVFADICSEFNIAIFNELLNGYEFNLQNNLGTVSVRRVERDPRKPQIDWGETTKYKKELLDKGVELYDSRTGEGEKWHIYYTDKFYCKFHWTKSRAKIKNKTAYRFDATRGVKGNKEKLTALLHTDELAYLRFKKYVPGFHKH